MLCCLMLPPFLLAPNLQRLFFWPGSVKKPIGCTCPLYIAFAHAAGLQTQVTILGDKSLLLPSFPIATPLIQPRPSSSSPRAAAFLLKCIALDWESESSSGPATVPQNSKKLLPFSTIAHSQDPPRNMVGQHLLPCAILLSRHTSTPRGT